MKYMGSKNRHAKEILNIISSYRKENQYWVEPFVGGCNIIDKLEGLRIGSDINSDLILMWMSLQIGWVPPDNISEEQYYHIRDNRADYLPALYAFVSIACSYSGKQWGGYARGNNANGVPRNYCLESKNNVMRQVPNIKGVVFYNRDYRTLDIPPKSIIYNDIPYYGTTEYKDKFNHQEFWRWCDNKVEDGHTVFVSEYSAPSDWKCVWEKVVNSSLTKDTGGKQGVERLFTK